MIDGALIKIFWLLFKKKDKEEQKGKKKCLLATVDF